MGHIGVKGLQSTVDGLPFDDSTHTSCEVCARANIRRSPFPKHSLHRATHLLERIHCDICGPLPLGYGNFQYYILFIDCYSRFITLFLMKTRNEALSLFLQFQTSAEKFCGEQIKLLHVDNAPELVQGQMAQYCKSHGITYEKTVPNSPSQNGVTERTNLTLCSMARAMLIDANLRDFFWPFAVLAATHIKQRVPHSSLPSGVTPFLLWFHHRPDLSHLRPFGTKCTARILTSHLSKFQPRGETGRFLGYTKDAKGYLIWVSTPDSTGGTLKVRRDVTFHDFPPSIPSPPLPLDYLPLWDNVEFPDRLPLTNDASSPIPPHIPAGRQCVPTPMPGQSYVLAAPYLQPCWTDCHIHSRPCAGDSSPATPGLGPVPGQSYVLALLYFQSHLTDRCIHSVPRDSTYSPATPGLGPMSGQSYVLALSYLQSYWTDSCIHSRPCAGDLLPATPGLGPVPGPLPTTVPELPSRPRRSITLPSKYSDFVPSSIIVDQLLQLDDDELLLPLPDGPSSAEHILPHILQCHGHSRPAPCHR